MDWWKYYDEWHGGHDCRKLKADYPDEFHASTTSKDIVKLHYFFHTSTTVENRLSGPRSTAFPDLRYC